jgi:Protein of unknown function (DUF2848)
MLTLQVQGTEDTFSFRPRRLVIAGYTGRDQDEVRRHVEELLAHGVPAPRRVPTLFVNTVDRLTTATEIEVLGSETSGEAEPVLLQHRGRLYVAAGSDHTDRELEKSGFTFAKQAGPKILSREVWPYEEVREQWDQVVLRGATPSRPSYQLGRLGDLLRPEDLRALMAARLGGDTEGLVLFGGTLAIADGEGFALGAPFTATLDDPLTGRMLRCDYTVRETVLTGDG